MKKLTTIPVTQEVLNAIAELDEFKGAWRLFGKLTPDRLRSLQKVALNQTITNYCTCRWASSYGYACSARDS